MLLLNNHVAIGSDPYTHQHKDITKIAVIGDSGVGKSSIIEKFTNSIFSNECNMTIGFNVITKDKTDDLLKQNFLVLLDVSGKTRFAVLRKSCYTGVNFYLAVCDLTSPESLHNLETKWIPEIIETTSKIQNNNIIIKIIGNKKDLHEKIAVSYQDLEIVAKRISSNYSELKVLKSCELISAKEDFIPEKLFKFSMDKIYK